MSGKTMALLYLALAATVFVMTVGVQPAMDERARSDVEASYANP